MCDPGDRYTKHDRFENEWFNKEIRKYITCKHMPDRWAEFGGQLCPGDFKTGHSVEGRSHDDYFELLKRGYRVWIVYVGPKRDVRADWIDRLVWEGPKRPSQDNGRNGSDWYYWIRGGRPIKVWLKRANHEMEEWARLYSLSVSKEKG